MKSSVLIAFIFLYALLPLDAEDGELWAWPVQGRARGEDILMEPTSLIHNEYRNVDEPFGSYLIGAEVGTPVVAVTSGIIVWASYEYASGFLTSIGDDTPEKVIAAAKLQDTLDRQWVHYTVGIEVGPGERVWYVGLLTPPEREFATGTWVGEGDVIGQVGYSYRVIEVPSVSVSFDIDGKRADPGPRLLGVTNDAAASGLSPAPRNYRTFRYDADDLMRALDIAYESLVEGHPALYDYATPEEVERAFANARAEVTGPLTSDQFFKVIQPCIRTVGDNHTYVSRSYLSGEGLVYAPRSKLDVSVGFFPEGCFLMGESAGGAPPGTEITTINGEQALDVCRRLRTYTSTGDGKTTKREELELERYGSTYLVLDGDWTPGDRVRLGYADGTDETILVSEAEGGGGSSRPSTPFEAEWLDDRTVRVKIFGMFFHDTDRVAFASLMSRARAERVRYLILDLRNNMGGEIQDSYFVYSFFASEKFYPAIRNRVTTNEEYAFAAQTDNMPVGLAPYSDYERSGQRFCITPETAPEAFDVVTPASESRFAGKVYVLTNGFTGSSAVSLAAYFKHFGRGVIIGTEGSNNYYRMNGMDFARVRLGDTGLVLNLPLVQTTFLDSPELGIPFDRGVVPDHPVSYSIENILADDDLEMVEAIQLIARDVNRRRLVVVMIICCSCAMSAGIAALSAQQIRTCRDALAKNTPAQSDPPAH